MEAGRDAVRDALEDALVGGEGALEESLEAVPGGMEAAHPGVVDEVRVEGEIELDVAAARRDRLGDELALDRDRVGGELLDALVRTGRDAERMGEQRRRRERHLERVVGDPGEELRLPRGGAADPAQAASHRVDCQLHALAARVRERDDIVGHDAVDRVVERVREHVAPELAVADHVEAELDLASDGLANSIVLHPVKRGQVFPPLLREQGVMARLVHRLDGRAQRCRA